MHALASFYNSAKTGSPIEDRMAGALMWLEVEWAGFPEADLVGGPADHFDLWGYRDRLDFFITPQARIGNYRADFLLWRSEEHTSELQSLMRISYAVFCLKKKTKRHNNKQSRLIIINNIVRTE